jgi:hypothetical protein
MLVLFSPSPQSIIRAFLASRVHNAKPMESTKGQKFFFEETLSADELDYDSTYSEYRERFGGLDFLEDPKLNEILEDEIFWASRFNARDRLQLIFSVLELIEREGTKAYLSQTAPEAKEMKDRVRRVTAEFRRAKGFLAFSEDADNRVLVGKGSFEHRIVDLVLRHFAKRKPGYAVAVLDDEHAHICLNDEILVDSRDRFPEKRGRKDAKRYWLLLSDLKNLESKRDPTYDDANLPRNYGRWVSEGTEAIRTSVARTLDDFA